MTWRWLGLLLVAATVVTTIALNLHSDDRDTYGAFDTMGPEYVQLTAKAFLATEVRTVQSGLAGDQVLHTGIEYSPPSNWRTNCHNQPYCSTIVILDQAWNLHGETWVQIAPTGLHPTKAMAYVDGVNYVADGPGPMMADEATTRLKAEVPYYGSWRYAEGEGGSELPRRTYEGTSMTVLVLEGNMTGRVHEATVLIEGPNLRDEAVISFEYDVDVKIEPPEPSASASQ